MALKQPNNVCEIPKTNPRTYIFQREFLVGLYFVTLIRTFEFSNRNSEKGISQRVRSYYSRKLCLLHELRDTNLIYQKLALQFTLKFVINTSCFDKESRGCAFDFLEIIYENK